jgi:diphthine methyl ester synthase
MNAIGACGLQLYNFGQTVSLVFFTETWKPDSFYDRIKENADLGLHTLVLLDIKVKEQSEENLARCVLSLDLIIGFCNLIKLSFPYATHCFNRDRGRKIYEPPRYMSIPLAVNQLIEIEAIRQTGILDPDKTLAVAVSRVGGDADQQKIVAGTLTELSKHPEEAFGEPLHSLVIVGKRLHHLEVEYAGEYAVNKELWLRTAKDVYGCNLDD